MNAYGQEKRFLDFNNNEVPYFISKNFNSSLVVIPNLRAKIIIVNEHENLQLQSKSVEIFKNEKILRKDYSLFYFLKLPKLKSEKQYLDFLKELTDEIYNMDYFNRNTISIDFKMNKIPISCKYLEELNKFIARVNIPVKSNLINCNKDFISTKNNSNEKIKTSEYYEPILFISKAENLRENYKIFKSLNSWGNTYFFSVKRGHQKISKNQRTEFDEETLTDFSNLNTIWNIDGGYMFSNKFGGYLNFGILTSKASEITVNEEDNSITFVGNGAGVVKIGLGVKYIAFTKNRWSIYADLTRGNLIAKAGVGIGNINSYNQDISTVEKTEKSKYLNFSLGTNYRLGSTAFLTGNIQYSISNFENNIGSVSGFTGYTINLGLGISFK